MDRQCLFVIDWVTLVDWFVDDIQDAAEGFGVNWYLDGRVGIDCLLAVHQTVGGVYGDGANFGLVQVLGDLEYDQVIIGLDVQCVQNVWQVGIEVYVDDCVCDLGDRVDVVGGYDGFFFFDCYQCAVQMVLVFEMILMSFLVMEV